MKKFLLFLLLSLTAGALIFYYFIREKDEAFNAWKLVPYQSSIVIESTYPIRTWKKFIDSKFGEGYKNSGLYENTTSFFSLIDSLSGTPNAAEKLLSGSMLISGVPTAQDQFELLYIVSADAPEIQNIFGKLMLSIEDNTEIKSTSRTYQEQTIYELTDAEQRSLAFISFKDYLIASKSSFLIEMVIRLINSDYRNNFKEQNKDLFELPLLSTDEGNVYVNFHQLSRGFKVFVDQDTRSFFDPLSQLNGGAALDLNFSEKAAVMNGFSISYDTTDLLGEAGKQSPGKFTVVNYIPNNTQYIWTRRINQGRSLTGAGEIKKWLGEDINYLELPPVRETGALKVLLVDSRDPGEALNYFNLEAEKAAKEDTIYREYYAGYPLTEITGQEWPEKYFPTLYQPFKQNFFTILNNYIVLSNNLEALKIIIEDLENENTWGKNIELRQFLSLGLEESNINIIVHPNNFWRQMTDNLNPEWVKKFIDNEQFLKGIVLNILQLNRLEDKFYTSAVLAYEPQEVLSKGGRNLTTRFVRDLNNPLAVRPFIVRNHNNNQFEVLVQDEQKTLSLIDWEGNVLWADSISEMINGTVEQLDFYKNDKLQYFFTGNNKIFIIDRNGDKVEDYPIAIGKNPIEYSTVVDYDNSKNYRFLLADAQGSLYMTDKHGNILDGWTPNKLQGALTSKPFHVRIRAKDYIIAVQQRGTVHVMNRRGQSYPGFPIELKNRIGGNVYVQKGTDAEGTILTIVTEGGQLVKINLNGQVLSKENLYRPTREAQFYIVPEVQNNGYVIIREGLNRLAILDEEGNRKFEKDYLSIKPMNIQYYNFGAGKEILAITDAEQQFAYLYNEDGDLINNQPINSGQQVAILYFNGTKQFHVFKVYKNSITALTF